MSLKKDFNNTFLKDNLLKNLRIRKADVSDAEGIATVQVKSWQKTYKGLIPDSFLDNMSINEYTKKNIKNLKDNTENKYHNFVLELENEIIGILTVGINIDVDQPKDVGQIFRIYLLPGYEGKGLGSMLMTQALETFKNEGYKKASLWVLDSNTKARSWYEHKGWNVEGRSMLDHRDGFDLNEIRYIITI